MNAMPHMEEICKRVVAAYRRAYGDDIEAIYLYGSYARGDFDEDSDIDFAAIVKDDPIGISKKRDQVWADTMDEMRDMKNEMQRIHEEYEKRSPLGRGYHILTPTYFINTTASRGTVHTVTYNNKKSLTIGPTTYKLTWLGKDRIAIEIHEGFHTDYEIWERTAEAIPLMETEAKTK